MAVCDRLLDLLSYSSFLPKPYTSKDGPSHCSALFSDKVGEQGSSYQFFAEKERDTGFAADSPVDEILNMIKLAVENQDAL